MAALFGRALVHGLGFGVGAIAPFCALAAYETEGAQVVTVRADPEQVREAREYFERRAGRTVEILDQKTRN